MIKYDYDQLKKTLLTYLHAHRQNSGVGMRTRSRIQRELKISTPTFNCAMYELRGMGLTDLVDIGNAKIWFLTKEGMKYIKLMNEAKE